MNGASYCSAEYSRNYVLRIMKTRRLQFGQGRRRASGVGITPKRIGISLKLQERTVLQGYPTVRRLL